MFISFGNRSPVLCDAGFHFIWRPASSFTWTPVCISFRKRCPIYYASIQNLWIPSSDLFGRRCPKHLRTGVQNNLDAGFRTRFWNGYRRPKHLPRRSPTHCGPNIVILPESPMSGIPASKQTFTKVVLKPFDWEVSINGFNRWISWELLSTFELRLGNSNIKVASQLFST